MTIAKNKVRVQIIIDETDKEKLRELGAKEDRSVNYLINKAIKEYLAKNDSAPD